MGSKRSGIRIEAGDLSTEALQGVLEEFVTRDGTEFSEARTKIEEVLVALRRGEVEIWFDEATRTCNVVAANRP